MPTEVFEFKASRLGSFLIAIGSVAIAAAGLILWNQPDAPVDMRMLMGLFAIGALFALPVALYRLIVAPVMVRVSPEGLFIKNYDTTIPWDALEAALIFHHKQGSEIIEFVPTKPLHDVFKSGKLALGKKANNFVKLPDYAYSMTGIRGTNQDLLRAISVFLKTG